MTHEKERQKPEKLNKLFLSVFPNTRDNLKQIFIKVFYLISIATLLALSVYFTEYFLYTKHQEDIVKSAVKLKNKCSAADFEKKMLAKNSDYTGWLTVGGTNIDNPVYKTDNNSFYISHNGEKKKSAYGALFADYRSKPNALNTVIYGNNLKNGDMFGQLSKYRSLEFYKNNPDIEFSAAGGETVTYRIYAVFVLNSLKADDDGYIYNISRSSFLNEEDFKDWTDEAFSRSLIDTGVSVSEEDRIITLVTRANDFENARLVVMARESHYGDSDRAASATANPEPLYPAKWYKDKGIAKRSYEITN